MWKCVFGQAEDGIRGVVRSRGVGEVYKRPDECPGGAAAGQKTGWDSPGDAQFVPPGDQYAAPPVVREEVAVVFADVGGGDFSPGRVHVGVGVDEAGISLLYWLSAEPGFRGGQVAAS